MSRSTPETEADSGLGFVTSCVLSLFSAILLISSFAPINIWPLAYIALVPWGYFSLNAKRGLISLAGGILGGIVFWSCALWWLWMPTALGCILGILYLAVYWLLATMILRNFNRRGVPAWIAVPLVWTGLEFIRANVIPFEWFFLSQSQYQQLTLIQICDLAGQYGLSFYVAMVNGVVLEILVASRYRGFTFTKVLSRRIVTGMVVVLVMTGGILSYGYWRLNQDSSAPGPKIGVVQEAFPITLDDNETNRSELDYLKKHMVRTMELAGKGCDLVVWPETIIPAGLNRELLAITPSTMSATELRSVVSCFSDPSRWEPDRYVSLMEMIVGRRDELFYRFLATRYVLEQVATVDLIKGLNGETVRAIASALFGDEKCRGLDPDVLRTSVFMRMPDFESGSYPAEELAAARRLKPLFSGYFPHSDLKSRKCLASMISVCSQIVGCPVLAGGSSIRRNMRSTGDEDIWVRSNSVLRFDQNGVGSEEYSKVSLVPFSEYVPLKYTWPWFHKLLRGFVPPQMPQIEPGSNLEGFRISSGAGEFNVITPICYEGTFSNMCREMVKEGGGRAIMVNHSNDGWFVYKDSNGNFVGTTEHYQHLVHYVFRAVELRVPVYRTVNTGISGAIDSSGRITSLVNREDSDGLRRTMVAGSLCAQLDVDSRESPFAAIGNIFGIFVFVALLTTLFCPVFIRIFTKKT